jgi:hypothetical protein
MKIIVWDIDDVLNDLTKEWFANFCLQHNNPYNIRYANLKENPPNRLLNISETDYLKSLDDFRVELGAKINPLPDILSWFNKNGDSYSHFALTSAPLFYASSSAEWLFRNFGRWFNSFNFVPSRREGDNYSYRFSSKNSLLKIFNTVDAFIDDNPQNIKEADKIGIKTFLFPRPWNNSQYNSPEGLLDDLTKILT